MRIAVLTSLLFQETVEIQGKDRIVWGGAERYLHELCKFLVAEGHDVEIFQSLNQHKGREAIKSGTVIKHFAGIPVTCLPDTDDWENSLNPSLNMMFNEVSAHFDLQIYFATFLCWPYVSPKSISISHGIFWDYPHHPYRLSTEKNKQEWLKRQLYGFTAPDVCVSVDSNVKKVISAISPGDASKIRIIYNFVDTKEFTPGERDWEDIRVLYPRRLTSVRGCNHFIRASVDLPQYKYLAVGQARDEKIETAAQMWSDGTNIKFISREMSGMAEVYQQADISVVPTTATEGLSLSLLESMSCGLPVITTPVGGLGDAVIPGHNALLYDPDEGGLSDCIRELAENEALRIKFGQRNREIAQECFDIEIWKQRWRKLIHGFGG